MRRDFVTFYGADIVYLRIDELIKGLLLGQGMF